MIRVISWIWGKNYGDMRWQNVTWEMVLMFTSYCKQSYLPDYKTEAPVALFWDSFQELPIDSSLEGHSVLLCSKHEASSSLRGMTIMPPAASELCWAGLPSYTIEALSFQVISSAHRTPLRKQCARSSISGVLRGGRGMRNRDTCFSVGCDQEGPVFCCHLRSLERLVSL